MAVSPLSLVFPIRYGRRRGYPLSPLLFALVLEPLLRKVRSNIKGMHVGSLEHKLSAYADNVFFHVLDPLVSLPNLIWRAVLLWCSVQLSD